MRITRKRAGMKDARQTPARSLADQSIEGHQRQKHEPGDAHEDDAKKDTLHGVTTEMSSAPVNMGARDVKMKEAANRGAWSSGERLERGAIYRVDLTNGRPTRQNRPALKSD